MEIGSIFLVLAVAIAVGLFVALPFMGGSNRRITAEGHELSALMAERDRIINSLQELDFDFALNKIPTEDYPMQRAALLQRGAEVLKQLDALTPPAKSGRSLRAPAADDAEARIESAVSARREEAAAAVSVSDDDVEAMIAARRTSRKEKSGGFCPRCGKPYLASDRFCPHCGKSIS